MLGVLLTAAGFWALSRAAQAKQLAIFHALLHEAEQRIAANVEARVKAEAVREAVEHALGMVKDITQVRAATPPSITPHLDAIEAETAAFRLRRERDLAAASDARFNEILKENKG